MWLWAEGPPKRPQSHKVNQTQLFYPLSIKRLYTWPNMVEIIFYHQTHIQTNGDPSHGACDPRSTSRMSTFAPCMSHKLKEFIWTQLGLYGTPWNKFMTSTRKFGGHEWMRMNRWPTMISYNSKISRIWIGSTRGALGAYMKTRHFPFNHWWHLISITHGWNFGWKLTNTRRGYCIKRSNIKDKNKRWGYCIKNQR
jgi:hypothetical protein